MVLKKGERQLKAAIDQAIDELGRDGTLKRLSEKYFHEDITCKS